MHLVRACFVLLKVSTSTLILCILGLTCCCFTPEYLPWGINEVCQSMHKLKDRKPTSWLTREGSCQLIASPSEFHLIIFWLPALGSWFLIERAALVSLLLKTALNMEDETCIWLPRALLLKNVLEFNAPRKKKEKKKKKNIKYYLKIIIKNNTMFH